MSDPVANDIADAVLRAGRKHGLNSAQLMHEMAKLLAAMTGTMTKALAERTTEESLTPANAAKASTLNVAIGEPEKGDPHLYYFRTSDQAWFQVLGSRIKRVDWHRDVPLCTWSPAASDNPAALSITSTILNDLDVRTAAENSAFRIAYHMNAADQSAYWIATSGKYIFQSGTNWFLDSARPEDCPEFGWKPVENSEVAAIISEKARTL